MWDIFSEQQLIEKYVEFYGDIFPEPIRFELTKEANTIKVVYNEKWFGYFTFNSYEDFKLIC